MKAKFGKHPDVLTDAQSMRASETCSTRESAKSDWARGTRLILIWGLPSAILVASAWIDSRHMVLVWPSLLTWMGVACLLNARRCHRLHCYLTGPYFVLLALVALLHGLGIVPLGPRGGSILSIALIVGGPLLVYVPEWILGRYRMPAGDRYPQLTEDQ
jgi:hypothetical protein